MVTDGERIDGCPKSPSGPLANIWVSLPRHDQSDQVANVSCHYRASTSVGAVTYEPEEKHNRKSQGSTDSGESVRGDALKPEGPRAWSAYLGHLQELSIVGNLHDDRRGISCQRGPCRKHSECRYVVRPPAVMRHCAPYKLPVDGNAMNPWSLPRMIILLKPLL